MAKRFTDSGKWGKPFLRKLQAPYKLFWLYILDECDHAGIYQVDLAVAQIKIGEKLSLEKALSAFASKILVFDGGEKWFIPDFIEFQYGTLKNENRAHNSVIQILRKYNLLNEENKPLISPLQGAMDMDKDKDKDMDKDMDKVKVFELKIPFSEDFLFAWDLWKTYKKQQHAFQYKSILTEQAALNDLVKLSEGSEQTAKKIIEQSIAKGWQGLFKLTKDKINTNGEQSSKVQQRRQAAANS